MKAHAREAQIEIDASPEEVFDLIHDYDRRLEWDPFLKEARLLGTSQAGVGAVCRCVARNGFGGLAMEAVYVSFDRPDVAAVKMVKGPWILRSFAATLKQERIEGNRTRVTYRYNFETQPAWLSGIFDLICRWMFSSEVRNRLRHLKLFLERKTLPA
ncbi:MAG TPA: SRPBCC family protein [Thermoanaerobaculia bacterium]|jgi:hypothetical protein|nr:SRPBCC family protein [Thermoanaerobaculia bacterium]